MVAQLVMQISTFYGTKSLLPSSLSYRFTELPVHILSHVNRIHALTHYCVKHILILYLYFDGGLTFSRPRWSSCYRTYHWTKGSRVQIRLRTVDFKGNKNRRTTSIGEEVKRSASCRNILLHVKNLAEIRRQNERAFLAKFLPVSFLGVPILFARELWWMNQE
jgi:hypothetical protein